MEHDARSSWRDGPSKQAILDFVSRVTTQGGPNFVSVHQHVTTFEKAGVPCCERPLLNQFFFACRWSSS